MAPVLEHPTAMTIYINIVITTIHTDYLPCLILQKFICKHMAMCALSVDLEGTWKAREKTYVRALQATAHMLHDDVPFSGYRGFT